MAWFWRLPSGEQTAILFIGANELFRDSQKVLRELAKDGRLTAEQLAAFGVLSKMVANFLRGWQKKLKFHFAITKPTEGRPLEPADLMAMIANLLDLPEDKKPTSEPESGTPK